jgi:predicted amidohydrolase
MDRYYAAAIQTDFPNPADRSGIAAHTSRMIELIDAAVVGYEPFFDVRLVVFPEFAHAAPIYPTTAELLEKLTVQIPNEHTERYVGKARQHGIHIQTGTLLECDPKWPGHVFNTTCLIGPDGILSKYRKVHPWLPWEVHTSPHDLRPAYDEPLFPVVKTPLGRLGVAICYDWMFPEAIRALAMQGADVLIRVSAYMDPWGTAAPLDWWTLINRTRALEEHGVRRGGQSGRQPPQLPPFSWPGGSMIVDFDGRIPGAGRTGAVNASSSVRLTWQHCRPNASGVAAMPCSGTGGPKRASQLARCRPTTRQVTPRGSMPHDRIAEAGGARLRPKPDQVEWVAARPEPRPTDRGSWRAHRSLRPGSPAMNRQDLLTPAPRPQSPLRPTGGAGVRAGSWQVLQDGWQLWRS